MIVGKRFQRALTVLCFYIKSTNIFKRKISKKKSSIEDIVFTTIRLARKLVNTSFLMDDFLMIPIFLIFFFLAVKEELGCLSAWFLLF